MRNKMKEHSKLTRLRKLFGGRSWVQLIGKFLFSMMIQRSVWWLQCISTRNSYNCYIQVTSELCHKNKILVWSGKGITESLDFYLSLHLSAEPNIREEIPAKNFQGISKEFLGNQMPNIRPMRIWHLKCSEESSILSFSTEFLSYRYMWSVESSLDDNYMPQAGHALNASIFSTATKITGTKLCREGDKKVSTFLTQNEWKFWQLSKRSFTFHFRIYFGSIVATGQPAYIKILRGKNVFTPAAEP